MTELIVRRVESRADRRRFTAFPWQLYRGDPHWVPPLLANFREMVGFVPHPFYARNTIQTFLAERDGQVCGRIAAILNQGHNLRFDERRGFFGFFECEDDQPAANALFDAVRQWFADQGIYRLRGPTNPSLNHELGLLVDGFDSSPFFMMTYNPAYYQRLIEGYGFRKSQDLYAYWGSIDMLPKIAEKLGPMCEQLIERYDVRLRSMDRARFLDEVRSFLDIYNRSLVGTWGFVPMSDDEVRHTAKGLQHLIVPELAVGAEIDGRLAGVAFALLDYNPRIRAINGRLFPFGFLRLLHNRQAIKSMRVISTNVLPEFQRLGIGLLLMHALVPKTLEWKIQEAEFSWVLESNALSRGALRKGGAILKKTYRLFDLDDEPPQAESGPAPRRRWIVAPPPAAAGAIDVRPVAAAAERRAFLEFPWEIYRRDPHWVPPLLLDQREFLDRRKHPFFQHGAAEQFVAFRGGAACGRILVSDDPHCNQQHGEQVGCFGMFECVEDEAVAAALLDAAAAWARARGRTVLRGPVDYSTNYATGLLVEGFDWPPRVMMNHHPIYYAGLLEAWGLRRAKDLYAWWFLDPRDMVAQWRERAERIARRTGVVIRPFRRRDFAAEVRRCQAIYNNTLEDNWGSVRLTDAEFAHLARRINQFAPPEQVLLAEVGGQPVGLSITVPDLNEAIRPLDGRLTRWGLPLGALRLARRLKRAKTARMLVLSVLAPFRRRGIAEMLILQTLDYGKNVLGYTGAELSWTLEDNATVNRAIATVGGKRYKTYRVYEKPIG
jgi:GNAT superfamily N-acetyltransferase